VVAPLSANKKTLRAARCSCHPQAPTSAWATRTWLAAATAHCLQRQQQLPPCLRQRRAPSHGVVRRHHTREKRSSTHLDVRSIPHEVGCHKGPRQRPSRNLNRTHEEQIA
jgi:hypothetical protein